MGGPVLKNKLFFFFDDENLRYVLPSAVVSLPSPQLQAYTLVHVPSASLPLYQDYFNLVNGSPGINRAVPVTNGSGHSRTARAIWVAVREHFRAPRRIPRHVRCQPPCAVAFGNNDKELNTERQYTIRADYNVTSSQKLFFRFKDDQGVQATGISPVNPMYNSISIQPSWQGNVNYS